MNERTRIIADGLTIRGARVGIQSDGPIDFIGQNVSMENVDRPYDLAAGSHVDLKNSRVRYSDALSSKDQARGGSYRAASSERRPHMPLPLYCQSCKSVSASQKHTFEKCYFNSFGVMETCPRCGADAELAEGVFDLTGDALQIISAPDFTHVMHAALQAIIADVERGAIKPEEAIAKAGLISPALAATLKKGAVMGAAVLTLLIAAMSCHYTRVQAINSTAQTEIDRQGLELQQQEARTKYEEDVRRNKALALTLQDFEKLEAKVAEIEARRDGAPEGDGGAPSQHETPDASATPKL